VHLDDRDGERLERVVDRPGVVRPRAGVDDHPVGVVVRVVAPLDELALAVRLPALHRELELACPAVDAALELGDAEAAVHRWVAAPEHVQVDAVQDDDPHAINLSSSRRTSSAGTETSYSSRSTSRSAPFLSRSSASQARLRSTRTGFGC